MLGLNINGHIKALCKNEDNNIEDLPVEYKSILATVNQLIDISKNECINTEDNSYRDRLKKSIKEIKNGKIFYIYVIFIFYLIHHILLIIIHKYILLNINYLNIKIIHINT